jgi:hypothetical protein
MQKLTTLIVCLPNRDKKRSPPSPKRRLYPPLTRNIMHNFHKDIQENGPNCDGFHYYVQRNDKKIIGSYPKQEINQAMKFAKAYSATFPRNRVIVENYDDAGGCSVWANSSRSYDNKTVILFVNGKRKNILSKRA